MRIGFLLKRGKPEARELAVSLGRLLAERGASVTVLPEDAATIPGAATVAAAELGASIDVLAVLGGDGTFLYGASLVADHGVPIFGVNLGNLGFITPYARSETAAAIEDLITGRLPIEERMRLAVTIRPAAGQRGDDPPPRSAVNDAVIT